MADEQKTTPAGNAEKKEETPAPTPQKYTYASLSENENYDDLMTNLPHVYDTNCYGKSTGIPSLQYFHDEMKGKTLPAFIEACKTSIDVIGNMPKPQRTMGTEPFDLPFNELPEFVSHAENLYSALVYFRKIAGYKPDKPESKIDKVMTLESLAEVQTPKQKRLANES